MKVIIDTGPIVAFLDKNDQYHSFVMEKFSISKGRFIRVKQYFQKHFFCYRGVNVSFQNFLELLASDKIQIDFSYSDHASNVQNILKTYSNLPCSFADACLVRMEEITGNSQIFTLDSDFTIYRTSKGKPLSVIGPF